MQHERNLVGAMREIGIHDQRIVSRRRLQSGANGLGEAMVGLAQYGLDTRVVTRGGLDRSIGAIRAVVVHDEDLVRPWRDDVCLDLGHEPQDVLRFVVGRQNDRESHQSEAA